MTIFRIISIVLSSDGTMPNFSFRSDSVQCAAKKNRDSINVPTETINDARAAMLCTVQALHNTYVTVNAIDRCTSIASRVITSPTSTVLDYGTHMKPNYAARLTRPNHAVIASLRHHREYFRRHLQNYNRPTISNFLSTGNRDYPSKSCFIS